MMGRITLKSPPHDPPILRIAIISASVAVGLVIGTMPSPEIALPPILQALIVLIPVTIALRSLRHARLSIRRGLGSSRLASSIFAVGTLIAIALPGAQLLVGARQSRLTIHSFPISPLHDVSAAYALTLLALLSVVVGEELAAHWKPAKRTWSWDKWRHLPKLGSRSTYFALLSLGVLGTLLSPHPSAQDAFASRTHSHGLGVIVTLAFCIPVAVALAVLASHWRSKILPAVSAVAIAEFVLYTGERTPLLIVGVAVMVRIWIGFARTRRTFRYVLAVLAVMYFGAVLLVGLSNWRALIVEGYQPSVLNQIYSASTDPFGSLTAGGLDTLDGMTLAMKIDPSAIGASWTDLTKAVTGFVPTQIWPSKPGWLTGIVAHYTNIGGDAGMFLSGPGYLYLIFGGTLGVAVGFCALGFAVELVTARLRTPLIATALLAYLLLRFYFAGDAYDIFHTATLVVGLFAGYTLGAFVHLLIAKPAAQTALLHSDRSSTGLGDTR